MAGNAIDRQAAIKEVDSAEETVATLTNVATRIMEDIGTINRGYVGASSTSPISKVYSAINNDMIEFMTGFCTEIYSIHNSLVITINASGTTTDTYIKSGNLSQKSWTSSFNLFVNEYRPGVTDFKTTAANIDSLAQKFEGFVSGLELLIRNYRTIWSLANDSGYESLSTAANTAAKFARLETDNLKNIFDKFSSEFLSALNTEDTKTSMKVSDLNNYLNGMKSRLDSIDFTVTKANEEVKAVSQEW